MTLPIIKYFSRVAEPDSPAGETSTAGLNSIVRSVDDLRQHLGDLATTQIEEAESTVHTLSSRLAELNSRLGTLAAIQRSMAVAHLALEHCKGSGDEPRTETILRAAELADVSRSTKLIQFPRSMRLHLPSSKSLDKREATPSSAISTLELAPPTEKMLCSPVSPNERCEPLEFSGPAAPPSIVSGAPEGATNIDFDERLLDDLIRNYGEFVTLSKSEPRIDAESPPLEPIAFTRQPSHAEPPVPQHLQRNHNLPIKEKDIDRQLKKIIQDYGEYDIYSVPASATFKYSTLRAIVLALVGLLLYFIINSGHFVSFSLAPTTRLENALHAWPQIFTADTTLRKTTHTALIDDYRRFRLDARATHPHNATA